MVTASSTSEKVPALLAAVNSGKVTEGLLAATVGATSVALTMNDVVVTEPSALVAVMVTVYGLDSSGAVPVQLQVPLWLPTWLIEPVLAVMVTASSTSAKVPMLPTAVNYGAVTEGLLAVTVGATSVALTVNEVVVIEPSALVAVMVTVYGLDSSDAVPVQLQVPLWLPT